RPSSGRAIELLRSRSLETEMLRRNPRGEPMHISVRQLSVAVALITPLCAQNLQRTATMRGGGNGRDGKCTIEVVVDGAADVEIRGNNAVLHNLSGQPAEWRRFECNAVMPPNPVNFRFQGIDGRGRQSLIRDP